MIQRYSFLQGRFGVDGNTVNPNESGEFILFSDHEAALKEKDEQSQYDHRNFNKEFAHMVDKKEEQIAALEQKLDWRGREVESWRKNFQGLDKNYDELNAEFEAYKQGNYDPAESIRLNAEVIDLQETLAATQRELDRARGVKALKQAEVKG